MTWREDLGTVTIRGRRFVGASFRGVPFFVEGSERSGGRRAVVHEFPLRDVPFVEDLGRRARTFHVDGYVIGDDYLAQRDTLLAALEDVNGSGELRHPYHGVRRAICVNLQVRETRVDGGMATFALEFAETPAQAPTPVIEAEPGDQVAARATSAVTATKAELAEKYNPAGLPSFALASAESAITKASAALGAKLSPVVDSAQELAEFSGRLSLITARASSLVRQPADIVDMFVEAVAGLVDTISSAPGAVVDALAEAYGVDLGPPAPQTTSTRERESANQIALTGALRRVMAISAARIAPSVPYASIEDATGVRDRIAALLEEQASFAGDTAYPALVDLRSQLLSAVPGTTAFASVLTITRRVAIPSLLLAYQLYGSVDSEPDILARNHIRHPGFIFGELKVLSDG